MKFFSAVAATAALAMCAVDAQNPRPTPRPSLGQTPGPADYRALIEQADLMGNNTMGTRVVGGSEAPRGKYEFNAGMRTSAGGSSFCGGALIAPDVVLTAAHCLPIPWVSAGTHFRRGTNDGQQRSVQRTVRHPSYDFRGEDYDFALLFLSSSSNTDTVRLASNNQGDESVGRTATVTGWGSTSEGGSTSDVLLEVDVDIVSNSQCNRAIENATGQNGGITNRMICAGGVRGEDACQGDSGGPLFVNKNGNPILVGDVSWGIGCARAGVPGVYGRISSVRSWIDDNVRRYSANDAGVNWERI